MLKELRRCSHSLKCFAFKILLLKLVCLLRMKLYFVDTIHPQSNKFITSAKIN